MATHHDPNVARAHDRPGDNIATRGAPKRMEPVSVHAGMTRRQMDMKGMGHAIGSAPDASAASPIDKTPPGKMFSPARPMIGQRSRMMDTAHGGQPGENHAANCGYGVNHDLGAEILREGFAASAADDCMAHGRARDGSKS